MRLGIFAKTFEGHTPDAVLFQAAAAGYSSVQYNMACSGLASMPDEIAPAAIVAIVDAAANNLLEITALSATYNMIHPDLTVRAKGHQRLAVLAAAAAAMNVPLITLCTGTRDAEDQWHDHPDNRSSDAWKDLLASMEVAVNIAEQHNILLGIEPELANVINSAASARQLLDEMKSPRIRIVLDPANLFETVTLEQQRRLVGEAVDLLADSIEMCHAKDRTASGAFTAAGTGVLDYAYYLDCLKSFRFDGALVTHGLSAREASGVESFLTGHAMQAGYKIQSARVQL